MTPHNVKSNMHVTSIDVKPLSPVKDRLAKANATRRVDHHRNEKWWFAAVPGAIFHHQDVVCGKNAMRRQTLSNEGAGLIPQTCHVPGAPHITSTIVAS